MLLYRHDYPPWIPTKVSSWKSNNSSIREGSPKPSQNNAPSSCTSPLAVQFLITTTHSDDRKSPSSSHDLVVVVVVANHSSISTLCLGPRCQCTFKFFPKLAVPRWILFTDFSSRISLSPSIDVQPTPLHIVDKRWLLGSTSVPFELEAVRSDVCYTMSRDEIVRETDRCSPCRTIVRKTKTESCRRNLRSSIKVIVPWLDVEKDKHKLLAKYSRLECRFITQRRFEELKYIPSNIFRSLIK